jgi:hypothetical protein
MSKPSFSFYISLLLIFILVAPVVGQTRVGKLGVGVDGSMQYLLGAGATNPSPAYGGGINLSYSVMESFGVRAKFTYSPLIWSRGLTNSPSFSTEMMSLNLYVGSDLLPNSTFNLFPFIGGGMAVYDPRDDSGARAKKVNGIPVSSFDFHLIGGLGVDYFLNEFWSVTLMGEYVLTGSPYYAGSHQGFIHDTGNDNFMRVSLQVRYYFFDQSFIKKLLNAQRERSKSSR